MVFSIFSDSLYAGITIYKLDMISPPIFILGLATLAGLESVLKILSARCASQFVGEILRILHSLFSPLSVQTPLPASENWGRELTIVS